MNITSTAPATQQPADSVRVGDRLHSTPLPQDHNHILAGNTDI
jgi:hypothetical protein